MNLAGRHGPGAARLHVGSWQFTGGPSVAATLHALPAFKGGTRPLNAAAHAAPSWVTPYHAPSRQRLLTAGSA